MHERHRDHKVAFFTDFQVDKRRQDKSAEWFETSQCKCTAANRRNTASIGGKPLGCCAKLLVTVVIGNVLILALFQLGTTSCPVLTLITGQKAQRKSPGQTVDWPVRTAGLSPLSTYIYLRRLFVHNKIHIVPSLTGIASAIMAFIILWQDLKVGPDSKKLSWVQFYQ